MSLECSFFVIFYVCIKSHTFPLFLQTLTQTNIFTTILIHCPSNRTTPCSQERACFGRESNEMTRVHEQKLQEYIEESEIKHKMEMFEVEERKTSQIERLIETHEESFMKIRNYYNDITLNNLALISTLKEQMAELRENSDKNEKLMAEAKQLHSIVFRLP